MPPEAPRQIGPYEILGPLGRGAMGAVFKAMQPSLHRTVAIKTLPADFASDPERVARFRREAETVAMLSHPNIVQIIDQGEDQGTLYFAMEYVEGSALDVVLRQRRLSLQETLQVVKQVSRGLGAAHRAGVVHRDLNPRNILVSPTLSVIKLADFGISRVESRARTVGTLTTREMTLGSLHYLAPEQAVDASAVDHRADIYSLGVVFYEMLTGRMPLGKFSLPSELNKDLPSEIDPVVLKCLATEPGRRYSSIDELLGDVERLEELLRFQLLDELKGLKRGTSMLFRRGSTSFRRNRGLLVTVGLGLLALAGAGAYFLLQKSPPTAGDQPVAPAPSVPSQTPPTGPSETPSAAPLETPSTATPESPTGEAPAGSATSVATASPPTAASPSPAGVTGPATERPKSPAPGESKPRETAAKGQAESAQADLDVARGKFEAGLYDQALVDARAVVANHGATPAAFDGYFLIARALEKLGKSAEAIGTYVEIRSRYRSDPRVAEAAFHQARLVAAADSKKSAEEARRLYGELAFDFPESGWAVRALAAKAELERSLKLNVRDPALDAAVPAALQTYRQLTQSYPGDAAAEKAYWELGRMYEDLKKWELAAAAYSDLASRFPKTRFDAWFEAAAIYDRRLKDPAKAKSAYAMVPPTSPRFKEAQKKAGG